MVHASRSFLVRFYAVDDELRARITDANASRSWLISDGVSARSLEECLVRDDPDAPSPTDRKELP